MRMHTKGYLMTELLIVCLILLTTNLIFLPKNYNFDMSDYRFMNAYNLAKSEAIKKHERVNFNNPEKFALRFPIYFSNKGNVNRAQTVIGHKHHLIIHLGNGYLNYED